MRQHVRPSGASRTDLGDLRDPRDFHVMDRAM